MMTPERRKEIQRWLVYTGGLQEDTGTRAVVKECLKEIDRLKKQLEWWDRLRPCVRTLARTMQIKLEVNAHKDGPTDREYLMAKLVEEVAELLGNPGDWVEAADVANLAMILCCYDQGIPWYEEKEA